MKFECFTDVRNFKITEHGLVHHQRWLSMRFMKPNVLLWQEIPRYPGLPGKIEWQIVL